jgi:hypothetical protein
MGVDIKCATLVGSGCATEKSVTTSTFPSSTVKRSLFGPVDHDEAIEFFKQEFSKIAKEQQTKYNFDFAKGEPLRGAFKWEKVQPTMSPCKVLRHSKVTKTKRTPLRSKTVNRDVNHRTTSINGKQSSITGE